MNRRRLPEITSDNIAKSQVLDTRIRTSQKSLGGHRSQDHTPQTHNPKIRNPDQQAHVKNKSSHSRDPTPQRRNTDTTPQKHKDSSRNRAQDVREQSPHNHDTMPKKNVVHQSRDHTPQSVRNENKLSVGKNQRSCSRDPTPQERLTEKSSWNPKPQSHKYNSPNRAQDGASRSSRSRDPTPQRNVNARNQRSHSQDGTAKGRTSVDRRRDHAPQPKNTDTRNPGPGLKSVHSCTLDSGVNTHQCKDLDSLSRNSMSQTPNQTIKEHRSLNDSAQHSAVTRSQDRAKNFPTAEEGTIRKNVHDSRLSCSSDRLAKSRDHTPQRRERTSRSRDHTPDKPVSGHRSRKELYRVKNPQISQTQEWPPPFWEKAMRQKLYAQRDRTDGKPQQTVSPSSGEKKSVRPGAPSEPNEYNFNYKRRGLFIIINNKNFHPDTGQQSREGTDVDAERLEERFQDLGFEVKRYDDVTRSKMSTLMYDAAAYDHSDADCFGCAILSHGLEGRVYGTDGYVSLEVLVMPFKGDKCPTLVGKPKLFFLQACRGTKMDYGVDVSDSSISSKDEDEIDASSTVSIRKIPIEADFLFAYSTVPGYYSWRNNQDGSWFIQALCIVLENYGMKMELLHMLTHVNRIVAYEFASCTDREFTDKMKQMPCVVSMLTRYVYFRHKKQDIR